MKKEARILMKKAIDSLIISIEHFNRPWDRGRVDSVLILLDYSFEMLLKAAILHSGGKIREARAKQTIGFDACVRRALNDEFRFITKEQALTLQTINSLRDAAQHHILDISERLLYLHAQAGFTLFRDILKSVFDKNIIEEMPERVLPISTLPPPDLATLFDSEVEEVKKLLNPGSRHQIEASARLRSLAIMEGALQGEKIQPGKGQLQSLMKRIKTGETWNQLFPGVASISLVTEGTGPSLSLRISKNEGIPIQLVPEGTPGATVVAVKRVDELGFYSLGRDQLAEKVGLTGPKTTAVIWKINLKTDPHCYKKITVGNTKFDRYSENAILRIKETIEQTAMEEIWEDYKSRETAETQQS